MWNNEFKLPDGFYSMSNIQNFLEYIIKQYETLAAVPPIHVYINRINNRLAIKIKDGYQLELQMPETLKVSGSTKKLISETKNRENVPSLQVVEVVLVLCILVDN